MKHRVKIEVPLSGVNNKGEIQPDTFAIQPPCFYCGKPIASNGEGYFNLSEMYKIKFWGCAQDSGKPRLGNVIDAHGNIVKGKYSVKIPYCPEHIEPVRTFTVIDFLAVISGILLGIGLTAFFGKDIFSRTPPILAFIIVPLVTAGIFYGLGEVIKFILSKLSSRLKEYGVKNGHYGICSHGVRVEGGEEMEGPITYWLKLGFCHPEGAHRFLKTNPAAKVVHGRHFLRELT